MKSTPMCDLMECTDCQAHVPNEKIYCNKILELWNSLEDVPMNPVTESIEAEWNGFKIGTYKYDIWKWFEETFHISISDLL